MTKSLFLSTALAAGLAMAGHTTPAEAAPRVPAPAPLTAQDALVQDAAWSCGPRRCVWMPGFRGPIPGYARTWGPPHAPGCHWKRGLLGKWKYKCDNDWD